MTKLRLTVTVVLAMTASLVCVGQPSPLLRYLDGRKWNELFPNRYNLAGNDSLQPHIDFYSFGAFAAAAASFPKFLSSPDTILQKRELSAFLANAAYETGGGWDEAPGGYYKWGLYHVQELQCENGCPQYTDTIRKKYPPVAGQSYHGRGPLQLSWNYNYGQFSAYYFNDEQKLLAQPSLVSQDPVVCFASALWFWMSAQYPKPSCHDIIINQWTPTAADSAAGRSPGFGAVVNVINGGIECGAPSPDTRYRYGYYLYFCRYFGVDPGPGVECSTQRPFGR